LARRNLAWLIIFVVWKSPVCLDGNVINDVRNYPLRIRKLKIDASDKVSDNLMVWKPSLRFGCFCGPLLKLGGLYRYCHRDSLACVESWHKTKTAKTCGYLLPHKKDLRGCRTSDAGSERLRIL
jgi:hypothetical protein